MGTLLGHADFLLPVLFLGAGGLSLVRSMLGYVPLPTARAAGGCLVALASAAVIHTLGLEPGESLARALAQEGGGLVGHWLVSGMLDWFGGAITSTLLGLALCVGLLLLFNLTLQQVTSTAMVAGGVGVRVGARGSRLAGAGAIRTGRAAVRVARQVSRSGHSHARPLLRAGMRWGSTRMARRTRGR
jgi:hypothetical protein